MSLWEDWSAGARYARFAVLIRLLDAVDAGAKPSEIAEVFNREWRSPGFTAEKIRELIEEAERYRKDPPLVFETGP